MSESPRNIIDQWETLTPAHRRRIATPQSIRAIINSPDILWAEIPSSLQSVIKRAAPMLLAATRAGELSVGEYQYCVKGYSSDVAYKKCW